MDNHPFGRVLSALGSVLLLTSAASAADLARPNQEQSAAVERVFAYGGFDFTSHNSYFGWLGTTIAPIGGLDTSGLRIGLFGGIGSYKYTISEGGGTNTGRFTTGDVLVGYGWVAPNVTVNLLLGGNVQDHRLSIPDPGNPVQGTRGGFKVQADTYLTPASRTMVYALGSYSTAFRTFYTELDAGYDITGNELFLGPQVAFLGNERFEQWRVGGHISAFKFGLINVELSGGYLQETDLGAGAYGTIGINARF